MEIVAPTEGDWEIFRGLAAAEGWRVPARELELYAGTPGCSGFVLKGEDGCHGFVTAVVHERSGWIGNLLVPRERRGRGYGARLFDHAMGALAERGCGSVWLTASDQGRPLYVRRGFVQVDRITRWVGKGGGGEMESPAAPVEELFIADRAAWGESRRPLLEMLTNGGKIYSEEGTVLLLQGGHDLQVLGPWYSPESCPRQNRQVLGAALASAGRGEIVADLLTSSPLGHLLAAAGFRPTGECALMVRGPAHDLRQGGLVALASLGSMG